MQIALKNVGQMSNLSGINALTSSPLWEQPVDKIHPLQLHALVWRYAEKNQRDIAETAIQICLAEVNRVAVHNGEDAPLMLNYRSPYHYQMTKNDLRAGLVHLGVNKAAAVLFALESGMDGVEVASLTWNKVMRMFQTATLTSAAIACIKICPRQLHMQYVFWCRNEDGEPRPIFGLDADVFDAFGLVWAELEHSFAKM
jgi:hypothetical protein